MEAASTQCLSTGESSVSPGKLRTRKHLDDLSALGIACCHLTGNYLPLRAVDRPTNRWEWQSGIRPRQQGKQECRKDEEGSEDGNEACEADRAVRAAGLDWRHTPMILIYVSQIRSFYPGDIIVFHLKTFNTLVRR